MSILRWLLGLFRRREMLPPPDARCQRGIERSYMDSIKTQQRY